MSREPGQGLPREGADRYADTRAAGRAILAEHLGLREVTVPRLLDVAEGTLGEQRVQRCIEQARGLRLTQRYQGLSAIAALVAGTRHFGAEWWSRPHLEPVRGTVEAVGPTPDERLAGADSADAPWPPTLVQMGWWIADDVAIDLWGPLIDEVDLNDPRAIDRVRLPAEAVVGQQFAARFDEGGVVDVIVEAREGDTLGSRLGSTRHSVPAEVDWAWGVSCRPPGPFPLPGMNRTRTWPSWTLTRREPFGPRLSGSDGWPMVSDRPGEAEVTFVLRSLDWIGPGFGEMGRHSTGVDAWMRSSTRIDDRRPLQTGHRSLGVLGPRCSGRGGRRPAA